MTKRQFSFLLGLVGQAGCIVYNEPLQRPPSDAATDARRDGAVARDAAVDGARRDAALPDAEASGDAGADLGVTEDVASADDARDAGNSGDAGFGGDATDAGDADAARDAIVGPPADVAPPDPDDAQSDAINVADASDAGGSDVLLDAPRDMPIVGCNVDFTVSGVLWEDDKPSDAGDGGDRAVRVVGNVGALGSWTPTLGLPMTEKAPGAWSVTVALPEEIALEFKFVKMEAGRAPAWEQWPPFDSNRSLLVDCGADGGTTWLDAATEAGPANRAVGRSYGGAFGVRPLDATK